MNIDIIKGSNDFIESLRGKKATFMLSMSTTQTCNIQGITQAGLDGLLHLTPTLDAEFLTVGVPRSLANLAVTPKGVPTPALITRAVHLLHPFNHIELLNLGISNIPKVDYFKIHNFDIKPSESIDTGANINAIDIFEKGVEFGKAYECKDDYVILAESIPAGTTTATATAMALGYEVEGKFSSSFKNVPDDIKKTTIEKALSNIQKYDDIFAKLSKVSDNMIIFNAGFLLGCVYSQTKVVLAGGTQMAAVLLVLNSILQTMEGHISSKNIALWTTSWLYNDENSDIKALLDILSFDINAYATDFTFKYSKHPALKLYDQGEAKEGVGAGGSLVYAALNAITAKEITAKVESFLG